MELKKTMLIAAAAMRAQGQRMRVVAENLANANSLPQTPQAEPYRRKLVTFQEELDRRSGLRVVKIGDLVADRTEFSKRYDPGHPGADDEGYVRVPNVKSIVEMMDMREAQRSYEANINVIEAARKMLTRTIDILRS